jgi:hypothetical protein
MPPSMYFFASTSIDSLTVNRLILPIKAFTMLLDDFILILFLQTKANCKRDNISNSENATKVYQELTS